MRFYCNIEILWNTFYFRISRQIVSFLWNIWRNINNRWYCIQEMKKKFKKVIRCFKVLWRLSETMRQRCNHHFQLSNLLFLRNLKEVAFCVLRQKSKVFYFTKLSIALSYATFFASLEHLHYGCKPQHKRVIYFQPRGQKSWLEQRGLFHAGPMMLTRYNAGDWW